MAVDSLQVLHGWRLSWWHRWSLRWVVGWSEWACWMCKRSWSVVCRGVLEGLECQENEG